jgi:CDP-diacylglycerol--serine O-phosphatidyltransferase
VIPLILVAVLYVLLLASYTWQTLAVSTVAYLAALPISVRSFANRRTAELRAMDVMNTPNQDEPGAK